MFSNRGFSALSVVGILGLLVTSGLALYTYSLKTRYADIAIRDDLAKSIMSNGIMDYVVHSVKSRWCVKSQWLEDKSSCVRNDFKHSGSISRLMASNYEIMTMGENFIIQKKKDRLTSQDMANFSPCAKNLLEEIPTRQNDFQTWSNNWINCVGLNEITGEISLNASDLANGHPVKALLELNQGKFKELGYTKALIKLKKANKIEFPSYGREVNLDLTIDLVKTDSTHEILRSLISASPVELNRYSVMVAGDLHLESDEIPSTLKKGLYIANSLSLPDSATSSSSSVGVHFESPVFVGQRIQLPSKSTIEGIDYKSFQGTLKPNIYFSDHLYLGLKPPKTTASSSSSASINNESSTDQAPSEEVAESMCSNDEGSGAVCQGSSIFRSSEYNKLIHSRLQLKNSVSYQEYDGGLDYIAGPNLGGKRDRDSSGGRIIKACSDLTVSQTQLNPTMGSKLMFYNVGIGENIFYWENQSVASKNTFSLRHSNRFQTPQSDIPRGSYAKCFVNRDNDETLIRPQVYGTRSQVTKYEGGQPVRKNVFDVEYNSSQYNDNHVVEIPTPELFNDQGAELAHCPQQQSKSQYTALKGDFSDKAKVLFNLEYYLEAGDRFNVIRTINQDFVPKSTQEDSLDTVAIHSADSHFDAPYGFEKLTKRIAVSIGTFLNVDNNGNPQSLDHVYSECRAGIEGHRPDPKAVVYCTKALLGLNSRLKREGQSISEREKIISYIQTWTAMKNFRVGGKCIDKTSGDATKCEYGDADDETLGLRTSKKSHRYQIGEVFMSMTSKYKSDLAVKTASDGHYTKLVEDSIKTLQDKRNELQSRRSSAESDKNSASNRNCTTTTTSQGTDNLGNPITITNTTTDAACATSRQNDIDAAQSRINNIEGTSGDDLTRLERDLEKVDQINQIISRETVLNDILGEEIATNANIDPNKINLKIILTDLVDVIGDIEVALPSDEQALKLNIGTPESPVLKSGYDPRAILLKGGIPRRGNRFVYFYNIKINAFDPSYRYSRVTLSGDCKNRSECETDCLDGEKDSDSIIRTYIFGENFSKDKCIEFTSSRQIVTQNNAGKFITTFPTEFSNNISVKVESFDSNENAPAYRVTGGVGSSEKYNKLKTNSETYHYGFYDFACKLVSAFTGMAGDPESTEDAIKMASNGGFNDPANVNISFLDQTNHSWFFAPINPFDHFLEVEEENYEVNTTSTTSTQNIEIATDSIPNYRNLPDESEAATLMPKNSDGDELPFNEDTFEVHSVAGVCTIKKNVKVFTGFLVCRHLVIESGRSQPLQIIGTVIAGRITIPSDAVKYGVFFKSIFHPDAKHNLLKSISECNAAIDENPVWFRPEINSNDPGRVGKLAALDECSVINLRNKAQPFTWSKVDPDCGLVGKFKNPNTTGPRYSERMMCKDHVENYFITERWRSNL